MTERERADSVRDVVAGVVHHIDLKRWNELRALYADEVRTDYTSLFGGKPEVQSGEALIAGWRGVLEKVKTQHVLGPIVVELESAGATACCHVRAMHCAPGAKSGEHWEVLGHYVFSLKHGPSGWKISEMKLETLLQTGNPKLLAEASAG